MRYHWDSGDRIEAGKQVRLRLPEDIHRRLVARAGSGDESGLLALLDGDLAGPVIVIGAPHDQVAQCALQLVRWYALRAMDAWHVAVAAIVVPPLLEPGESQAFASRDQAQRQVAAELGFVPI